MTKFIPFVLMWIMLPFHQAESQVNLYTSTFTCDGNSKSLTEAANKLRSVLTEMTTTGKLINYSVDQEEAGSKSKFIYTIPAENQEKLTAILADWKKLGQAEFPTEAGLYFKSCTHSRDTVLFANALYPAVHASTYSLVLSAPFVNEWPDKTLNYNIVVDLTSFPAVSGKKDKYDSASANWGLSNIGRVLNLHVASGIPKEKINMVVAVHGFALWSFLNQDAHRKKYQVDNPNLMMITELQKAGVRFLVCGQSILAMKSSREALIPEVKVTLTAQTTLTSYQVKGYALLTMSND